MIIWLRSLLFNIVFYSFSLCLCIAVLPCLLLPRAVTLFITRLYVRIVSLLEELILGLSCEIRGRENLPESGAYIVAAKHQSAYETLKLHCLFDDPSIILKQELLHIPFWGWFLGKLDPIAIDRSDKEGAMVSIIKGALRVKDQGRPIVIFPQGTRVHPHATTEEKPYKGGIIKMYNATKLPIIPMALNTGLFWEKNSFLKKPGRVVLEFLPAIEPGLPEKKVMKALEDRLELNSLRLMNEARERNPAL